ncbi:glycosyltransferase family 2 protein [Paenibacillus sp. FSL R7-0331]|uniref:glycosyltransferase family 2 protein n=1 Tax=Paenibacillus sp. FSL R7-0331 TaxID=1536773 RepID=UPI0006938FB0|nr:glycosyltransferase [Paenibacillus sp. FSL R7-0331]
MKAAGVKYRKYQQQRKRPAAAASNSSIGPAVAAARNSSVGPAVAAARNSAIGPASAAGHSDFTRLAAVTPPDSAAGAVSVSALGSGKRPVSGSVRKSGGRPASGKKRAAGRKPAARRQPSASRAKQAQQPPGKRRGTLSVIISARNEAQTLPLLLKQVQRLAPDEIIVVLNGCTDNSFQRTRTCRQAIIVHIPESAGHDVGRALGAKLSKSDILLFLDGDMVIPAPQLAGFTAAVDGGVDVALNDLDHLLPPFKLSDSVTRCKLYLNIVLGRSDLGASSMTAVPHALSRRALEMIGYRELMVPPKAQALALLKQLQVQKAGTVNVFKQNRLRRDNTGAGNKMEQLIAGDHAEALNIIIGQHINHMQRSGHAEAVHIVPGQDEAHSAPSLQEQRSRLAAWRNAL